MSYEYALNPGKKEVFARSHAKNEKVSSFLPLLFAQQRAQLLVIYLHSLSLSLFAFFAAYYYYVPLQDSFAKQELAKVIACVIDGKVSFDEHIEQRKHAWKEC